ncbi:hypothetical protein FO519_000480 [Halicephalobus sp. NKZ332]|nr:hypothetical protein FO519_000480 [Halicephalobus sp. NKZ332]
MDRDFEFHTSPHDDPLSTAIREFYVRHPLSKSLTPEELITEVEICERRIVGLIRSRDPEYKQRQENNQKNLNYLQELRKGKAPNPLLNWDMIIDRETFDRISNENQSSTPVQSVQHDSSSVLSEPTGTPSEPVQVLSDPERSPPQSEQHNELPPPGFIPGRLLEHVPYYARIRRYAEDVNYLNKIGEAEKPPIDEFPQLGSDDLPNPASLPRPSSSGNPTPISTFNVNSLDHSNVPQTPAASITDIPSIQVSVPFVNSASASSVFSSVPSTRPQTPTCSYVPGTSDSTSNPSTNPPSQRRRRFMSSKTNGSDEGDSKLEEYTVDIEPVIGKKQVTIPLPRKESTWANVNPAAPCLDVREETPVDEKASEREKSGSVTPEPSTPVEFTSRRRTKSVEEKKKLSRKTSRLRKNTKEAETNTNDEESDNSEDKTYDLEKIISHREVIRKKKKVTEYLVRWLGYDESADTWEPEENILGPFAKEQLKLYWESQREEKDEKETPGKSPGKEKRGKGGKKRKSVSKEEKFELRPKRDGKDEEEKASELSSSTGSVLDNDDEPNHIWFGIKEEDVKSKNAKREFKNLFVSDRKLSLSEKLLAGYGNTGRVTRSVLKPLKEDVTPHQERKSRTPEPASKRRRVTESPATVNRYSPEPPTAKKARKSLPAQKTSPPEKQKIVDTPVITKPAPPQIKEPQKRASDAAEPPSKTMPKIVKKPVTTPPVPQVNTATLGSSKPSKSAPKLIPAAPSRTVSFQSEMAPPLLEPIIQPILDPRAPKKPETVHHEDNDYPEGAPDIVTDVDFNLAKAPKVEIDDDDIPSVLTNEHFQEAMKDYEPPPVDIDVEIAAYTTRPLDIDRVAASYDEFVEAVIDGNATLVYSSLKYAPDRFDLNDRDAEGRTLLHHLAHPKCTESHPADLIAKMLVMKGADLCLTDNTHGRTPLHTAVSMRNHCIAQTLIDLSSPINTIDKKKHTPLLHAIFAKDAKMVSMLLKAGVNIQNIHMVLQNSQIGDDIKKLIKEHKKRIIDCMDTSRRCIFPQCINGRGTIESSLFTAPIAESETVEYSFEIKPEEALPKPNNYLSFECALLQIDQVNGTVNGRMWQQSPIRKLTINGSEPINLHKTTNFISFPQLKSGTNIVKIELMNTTYQGTGYCLASRLCHIIMNGFLKTKRLEPTPRNLMPLGMSRMQVPPAIRQLSNAVRPRSYRQPLLPLSRQNTPAKKIIGQRLATMDNVDPRQLNYLRMTGNNAAKSTVPSESKSPTATSSSSTTSSPTTTSSPIPGFVPLPRSSLTQYSINRSSLASRSLVTPLTSANNRLAVKQSQPKSVQMADVEMESTANATESEVKGEAIAAETEETVHENGTNGNDQSNDEEGMDQTNSHSEESKPPVQYSSDPVIRKQELVNNFCEKKLSQKVATRLADVIVDLDLSPEDFDERAVDLLSTFSQEQSMFIIKEIEESQLFGVQNRAQYLMAIMRNFKERLRTMGSNSTSVPLIPGPKVDNIKAIINRTNYMMEVTVGQRKYHCPPECITDNTGGDHELYIGQIPRDVYEDQLIPIFEDVGQIWDLRLMMDPVNGKTRGYAFLIYVNRAHALEAAKKFNGYEIQPGKMLKVNVSVANTRLFIGNIPKSKSKEEILDELKKHAEGVVDVIVYTNPDAADNKKNRGFCFVDFTDHKSASDAKRRVTIGKARPWNSDLVVDWAEQQEEPDEETMAQVKVVYVKNLKETVTEESLVEMFKEFGEIDRAKKIRDYAFIHYKDRDSAVKALEEMKGREIDGVEVEISLAKPQTDSKQRRSKPPQAQKRQSFPARGGARGPPAAPYNDYYTGPPQKAGRGGNYGSQKYPSYPAGYGPGYDPYAGGYSGYPSNPYGGYDPYGGYNQDPYYTGPYTGPARGGFSSGGGNFNRGAGGNRGGRGNFNSKQRGGRGGNRGAKRPGDQGGGPASKRGGHHDFSADIQANNF